MEVLRNIMLNKGIQDIYKQMDWSDNNWHEGRASQHINKYNVIGMDKDFQDDYNTVGMYTNQMF